MRYSLSFDYCTKITGHFMAVFAFPLLSQNKVSTAPGCRVNGRLPLQIEAPIRLQSRSSCLVPSTTTDPLLIRSVVLLLIEVMLLGRLTAVFKTQYEARPVLTMMVTNAVLASISDTLAQISCLRDTP